MLRRFNTGYADGMYTFPSGHVEDNEPLRSAICRESREEVGVLLEPDDVTLVHVMHRRDRDIRLDFFFTTNKAGLLPVNSEPHRADRVGWFPLNKLPENILPYLPFALANIKKGILYSEDNW